MHVSISVLHDCTTCNYRVLSQLCVHWVLRYAGYLQVLLVMHLSTYTLIYSLFSHRTGLRTPIGSFLQCTSQTIKFPTMDTKYIIVLEKTLEYHWHPTLEKSHILITEYRLSYLGNTL